MSEGSFRPEPVADTTRPRVRRVQLLVEVIGVVVLVGAVWWLAQNYRPRSFLGRGLLDTSLWILVLLVSAWGTAGSLIPYYAGQRGTEVIFDHYPGLEGQRWERLEAIFRRWGAPSLILSGIPGLGAALLVAAGAFGIARRAFLGWVFLGKVLRYWVLVFIILLSLRFLK